MGPGRPGYSKLPASKDGGGLDAPPVARGQPPEGPGGAAWQEVDYSDEGYLAACMTIKPFLMRKLKKKENLPAALALEDLPPSVLDVWCLQSAKFVYYMNEIGVETDPSSYCAMIGEMFFLLIAICYPLTQWMHPEIWADNPLIHAFGYNNVCVSFDSAPALYVAASMYMFVFAATLAGALSTIAVLGEELQTNQLRAHPKWIESVFVISHSLYAFTGATFVICFVVHPTESPLFHTSPFLVNIIAKYMSTLSLCTQRYLDMSSSHELPHGMWTYLIIFGAVSFAFVGTAMRTLMNQQPSIPWQLAMFLDWSWLSLSLLGGNFLPSPLLQVKGKLVHPSVLEALRKRHGTKTQKAAAHARAMFFPNTEGTAKLKDRVHRVSKPTADQQADIKAVVDSFRKMGVEGDKENPKWDKDLRHGYSITVFRAKLTLNHQDLRHIGRWHQHGLLSEESAGTYDALVRINISDEGGVRVSLRVEVPQSMTCFEMLKEAPDNTARPGYKHMDLLFAEQLKWFFAPDIKAMRAVTDTAQQAGCCSLVGQICGHLCQLASFVRMALLVPNDNTIGILGKSYYTGLPFKLGSGACKFGLEPQQQDPLEVSQMPGGKKHASMTGREDDAAKKYGAALASVLNKKVGKGGGKFKPTWDLKVQVAKTHKTMNPEKGDEIWDQAASPYHTIGSLELIPEPVKNKDPLFFNPWNMLKEHMPVGDINLARKEVYKAHQEMRCKRGEAHQDLVCPYLTYLKR